MYAPLLKIITNHRIKPALKKIANLPRNLYGQSLDLLSHFMPAVLAEKALLSKLRGTSGYLPQGNIELTYRIEKGLRALQDTAGANRWLHHRWVMIFEELMSDLDGALQFDKGFDYVCLGAGTRNSFAFPLLVSLSGANNTYIVEPDSLKETSLSSFS